MALQGKTNGEQTEFPEAVTPAELEKSADMLEEVIDGIDRRERDDDELHFPVREAIDDLRRAAVVMERLTTVAGQAESRAVLWATLSGLASAVDRLRSVMGMPATEAEVVAPRAAEARPLVHVAHPKYDRDRSYRILSPDGLDAGELGQQRITVWTVERDEADEDVVGNAYEATREERDGSVTVTRTARLHATGGADPVMLAEAVEKLAAYLLTGNAD